MTDLEDVVRERVRGCTEAELEGLIAFSELVMQTPAMHEDAERMLRSAGMPTVRMDEVLRLQLAIYREELNRRRVN